MGLEELEGALFTPSPVLPPWSTDAMRRDPESKTSTKAAEMQEDRGWDAPVPAQGCLFLQKINC